LSAPARTIWHVGDDAPGALQPAAVPRCGLHGHRRRHGDRGSAASLSGPTMPRIFFQPNIDRVIVDWTVSPCYHPLFG